MRFGVLGTLSIHDDSGALLCVNAPKSRALLAALLLEPNRSVHHDTLVSALWGDDPPATATASLYNHIARARRALGPHTDRVRSRQVGVELRVEAGELDYEDFDRLMRLARTALAEGDWEAVDHETSAALALWRGAVLADVPGLAGHPSVARLHEQRLDALDLRHEALLRLGRLDGAAAELRALVAEHPFRESLHRRLMLVLARTGRQAEALGVFRALRRTLVDELGVEPSPAVQEAHQEVLRLGEVPAVQPHPGPPEARPTTPRKSVAQLPAPPATFVGRTEQIDRVRAALDAPRTQAALVVISGMAGVGKSGLALHLADRLRASFPDNQLYLDLHGATPGVPPVDPDEAVTRLLIGLGVDPRRIPCGTSAATALLRSTLAATRTLLVLDDAASVSQVLPLLPAGGGCLVLLTSRTTLATLDPAVHLALEPLPPSDGALLVEHVSGRTWTGADRAEVARLVSLCGHLPLALRVAAARLRTRRNLTVARLADRLARPEDRLDHLELEDLSVRRLLRAAHDGLASGDDGDNAAATALTLIGALDLPEYSAPMMAWTMDVCEQQAERALERLAEVALLHEGANGHHTPHDLVRDFAREAARRPDLRAKSAAAAERALRWYVDGAALCAETLRPRFASAPPLARHTHPGLTDAASVTAWVDSEAANLLFLASQGTEGRCLDAGTTLELVNGLFPYLQDRGMFHDLTRLTRHAVDLTRASGDPTAEGHALFQLATAHYSAGRLREAVRLLGEAAQLSRRLGDDLNRMLHLGNQATLLKLLGRADEARATLAVALELRPATLSPHHRTLMLGHQGHIAELTDPRQALDHHLRAADLAKESGIPVLRQMALCNVGLVHLVLGDPSAALSRFDEAVAGMEPGAEHWNAEREARLGRVKALRLLELPARADEACRELAADAAGRGDTYGLALVAYEHGHVRTALGDPAGARALWHGALSALEGTDADVLPALRHLLDP
ncbi:BTAD domain-containing putative transcriptional regulator [Streptomyces sp. NPDC097619]|uniref:AfsR/SARP family transcriptional regulator n=1 Tax=Streptomyces sp. NPDC097619 TaxID=3157228 RepID=UPI0033167704